HQFDDAALMSRNERLQYLGAPGFEHSQSARLVALHEAAVPDYICGQDRGKAALHTRSCSRLAHKASGASAVKPVGLAERKLEPLTISANGRANTGPALREALLMASSGFTPPHAHGIAAY